MTHDKSRYVKLYDRPEDVKRLADFLRPALNEAQDKYGHRSQRFSAGDQDTATAMAAYIIRNLATESD